MMFTSEHLERTVEADMDYLDMPMFSRTVCESAAPDIGLAPGGLIRQEIYEDEYSIDVWDQDNGFRLLGAAGDALGLEPTIKANTTKTRSYSFWRQGSIYYKLLPGMRDSEAGPLVAKFYKLMREHAVFRAVFGVILGLKMAKGSTITPETLAR